jgi:hypothetical protein
MFSYSHVNIHTIFTWLKEEGLSFSLVHQYVSLSEICMWSTELDYAKTYQAKPRPSALNILHSLEKLFLTDILGGNLLVPYSRVKKSKREIGPQLKLTDTIFFGILSIV